MTKKASLLHKTARAFFGATGVVTVLWLVAVLAVNVFAGTPPLGDRDGRFVEGVKTLKLLPGSTPPHRKGPVVVFLRNTSGGNPLNLTAWQTVVQILILITLAALVVAGLDQMRRKNRQRRRVRTV
jgi:hypothetical protein